MKRNGRKCFHRTGAAVMTNFWRGHTLCVEVEVSLCGDSGFTYAANMQRTVLLSYENSRSSTTGARPVTSVGVVWGHLLFTFYSNYYKKVLGCTSRKHTVNLVFSDNHINILWHLLYFTSYIYCTSPYLFVVQTISHISIFMLVNQQAQLQRKTSIRLWDATRLRNCHARVHIYGKSSR